MHGIARDLAASGLGMLKPIKAERVAGTFKSPIKWTHAYEPRPDSPCPIVVGRYFRSVKNGPSPDWLQRPPEGDWLAADLDARRYHQPCDL